MLNTFDVLMHYGLSNQTHSYPSTQSRKEASWLAAGGLVGLIIPRQLEEVQVSVPALSLHSSNQKALQLHQHVPLAPTNNQISFVFTTFKGNLNYFSIKSGKTITAVSVFTAMNVIQDGLTVCVCSFCPWCHGRQGVGSCGWQKGETSVATMGFQDSVSQPSSTQAGHSLSPQWHLRTAAMDTTSEGNGGAEGLCFGLDCTRCADKTTGKDRFGQGSRGSRLRLLLPQEELTHPSDHLPHLWRSGSDSQSHHPGSGNCSQECGQ